MEIEHTYLNENNEYVTETKQIQTIVLSAFPGCGKSTIFNNQEEMGIKVLDSDSSTFDKADFPNNYITHIKEQLINNTCDVIMVSSHKDVRDALIKENINFLLFYPALECKDEYLNRYVERGSPESFVNLLTNNYENWINEIDTIDNPLCTKICMQPGEYLMDYFEHDTNLDTDIHTDTDI